MEMLYRLPFWDGGKYMHSYMLSLSLLLNVFGINFKVQMVSVSLFGPARGIEIASIMALRSYGKRPIPTSCFLSLNHQLLTIAVSIKNDESSNQSFEWSSRMHNSMSNNNKILLPFSMKSLKIWAKLQPWTIWSAEKRNSQSLET